jgi:xylulokinase
MYILAFDIGTSGIKSILFSPDQGIVDSASGEYLVTSRRRGWAEQDPELWREGAYAASRALMERHPEAAK